MTNPSTEGSSASHPTPGPRAASAAGLPASRSARARRIAQGLYKISLALRHAAWRGAAEEDLTPTQAQVLAVLDGRSGPVRPGTIAAELALTPATVSEAVRALLRKGLVRRVRSSDDGRARPLVLTPRGRAVAARAVEWPDALARAAGTLSDAEQAVFLRAVVRMIAALQERGRIPVARMCLGCRYFRPYVHPDPARPHHCAYVDAPFGDGDLRLDCPDHEPAAPGERRAQERALAAHAAPAGDVPGPIPEPPNPIR